MNGIIAIQTNEENEQIVSARDLHKHLEVKKCFSEWFKANSKKFVEGVDFTGVLGGTPVPGGNGRVQHVEDFSLSIDMAKNIALVSGTQKGAEIRSYFIAAEKKWRQVVMQPMTTQQQIALIAQENTELNTKVDTVVSVQQ